MLQRKKGRMHDVGHLDISVTPTVLRLSRKPLETELFTQKVNGQCSLYQYLWEHEEWGLGRGQSWTVIQLRSMPPSMAWGALELSQIEARNPGFYTHKQSLDGGCPYGGGGCDLHPSNCFSPRARPEKWLSCEPSATDIPGIRENRYLSPGGRIWTGHHSMDSTYRTSSLHFFFQALE